MHSVDSQYPITANSKRLVCLLEGECVRDLKMEDATLVGTVAKLRQLEVHWSDSIYLYS